MGFLEYILIISYYTYSWKPFLNGSAIKAIHSPRALKKSQQIKKKFFCLPKKKLYTQIRLILLADMSFKRGETLVRQRVRGGGMGNREKK